MKNNQQNNVAFYEERLEKEKQAFDILSSSSSFLVCKRLQNEFPPFNFEGEYAIATIVDLETTGLAPEKNEIIEIAMVSFAYSKKCEILGIIGTYTGLSEPLSPLSEEVIQITGITQEQLSGQVIDWRRVHDVMSQSRYIICHNAKFDRSFLEQKTPPEIQAKVKEARFACTLEDINWFERGYEPRKLDYLNFKLGYFYEAHRALSDCWATLNLLRNVPGAFAELLKHTHQKSIYFFAKAEFSVRSEALAPVEESCVNKKMSTPAEVEEAYRQLAASPDYKIYQIVPRSLPIAHELSSRDVISTIIEIKINPQRADEITGITLLSFVMTEDALAIIDSYTSIATEEKPIQWQPVVDMLQKTSCLISHRADVNRKILESKTPDVVQSRVRALPFASTAQDVDWRKWNVSNTSLKYLSFVFGFFFEPECIVSQSYATLNLLRVAQLAREEILQSFNKNQTIVLVTGSFCFSIRNDLKNKGFRWSSGSGNMGKGWWATVDDNRLPMVLQWIFEEKSKSSGHGDIYLKGITPHERYSMRSEFKSFEMSKYSPKKRSAEVQVTQESTRLKM